MPVGRPMPTVSRYTALIVTVDPTQEIVEFVLKSGEKRQATVFTMGVAGRWPIVGETWVVRQENGSWYLDALVPNPDATTDFGAIVPGDAMINSPTGVIHVIGGVGQDYTITRNAILALPTLVTTFPASPVDGQVVDYAADAANGVIWRFRYRAASTSTYKWEFVGGAPLTATIDTAQTTASSSYVDLATVGPTVTVPRAGDYDVIATCTFSAGVVTGLIGMSYAVGATAAIDADAAIGSSVSATTNFSQGSNRRRKTALAASTALVAKYRTSAAATTTFQYRTLMVYPVRCI